jgi:hypothetical protein
VILGVFDDLAQLLEVLGVWLAAFATFGAAFVALRVANKANRQLLKLVARPMLELTRGIPNSTKNIFYVEATNIGMRPVTIRSLGFRCRFPRYDAALMEGLSGSSPIPVTLGDGERAHWRYDETRDDGENWYKGLAAPFMKFGSIRRFLARRNLRVFVVTSLGKEFFAVNSAELRKKLRAQMEQLEAK